MIFDLQDLARDPDAGKGMLTLTGLDDELRDKLLSSTHAHAYAECMFTIIFLILVLVHADCASEVDAWLVCSEGKHRSVWIAEVLHWFFSTLPVFTTTLEHRGLPRVLKEMDYTKQHKANCVEAKKKYRHPRWLCEQTKRNIVGIVGRASCQLFSEIFDAWHRTAFLPDLMNVALDIVGVSLMDVERVADVLKNSMVLATPLVMLSNNKQ